MCIRDSCHTYLCKVCVGEHILNESTEHKVVSIKQYLLICQKYPKCSRHSTNTCQLYCEDCIIPACVECFPSIEHQGHKFANLLKYVEAQKQVSQKDLQELESILTKHNEFASVIRNQKSNLDNTFEELKTSIDEHGEKLHKQVSDVVEKFKSDIIKTHENKSEALKNAEEKNDQAISCIEKCIFNPKEFQASADLGLAFEYKSRNVEFMNKPLKHNATLPKFVPNVIEKEKLSEQFGSFRMRSDEMKSNKSTASVNQCLGRSV